MTDCNIGADLALDQTAEPVETERWLPTHMSDFYEVSSLGRVRSWKAFGKRREARTAEPRYIAGATQRHGHVCMNLTVGGKRVNIHLHRLVLEAFVGPMPPGMHVRHLNGIPSNNRLSNLAYGTPAENGQDQIYHRLHGLGTVRPAGYTYGPRHGRQHVRPVLSDHL